jgi:hypothetical protein
MQEKFEDDDNSAIRIAIGAVLATFLSVLPSTVFASAER